MNHWNNPASPMAMIIISVGRGETVVNMKPEKIIIKHYIFDDLESGKNKRS